MNPFIRVLLIAFICVGAVFAQSTADVSKLRLETTLNGYYYGVNAVAYSPDGKFLVTGGDDGMVRLWNVARQLEIRKFLSNPKGIYSVAYNPNGLTIAASGDGGDIRIWNIATGQETVARGHTKDVLSIAFSPNGNALVSGSADTTARLWRIADGVEVMRFIGHTDTIWSVAFSGDGQTLATGSSDKTALLWNVATGRKIFTFEFINESITAVALSPDGRILAMGGLFGTALLYDRQTRKQTLLEGDITCISKMLFLPTSSYLYIITGSFDGTIRIWETDTGRELSSYRKPVAKKSPYFIPDLAVDLNSGNIASVDRGLGAIIIWSLTESKPLQTIYGHTGAIEEVKLSQDGKFLATKGSSEIAHIWDVLSGKLLYELKAHKTAVRSIAISPDSTMIATSDWDNDVKLWEAKSGLQSAIFRGHTEPVNTVNFSSDGRFIVTGSRDMTVRVWEISSRKELARFSRHLSSIDNAEFSPDGKSVVSAANGGVFLWSVATQSEIKFFNGHTGQIYAVKFSPDGNTIITAGADKTIRLWSVQTGQEIRRFNGHSQVIRDATFSPDGRILGSASEDTTARLWDIATGQEIGRLTGHRGVAYSIAFSSDGKRVAVGSSDTARIYSTPTLAPIFDTRQQLPFLSAPTNTPLIVTPAPPSRPPVGFDLNLKPSTPHQSITALAKGCIRINTTNPETVTCRITFALLSGETPVQAVSIRAIDTASRVITPYQFAFLIPNAIPSKNATLTTSPLTLEFYMTIPKEITRLPILDVKVGNSSLWEYTPRFQAVPISQ